MKTRKFISVLMVLSMILCYMPSIAFADTVDTADVYNTSEQVPDVPDNATEGTVKLEQQEASEQDAAMGNAESEGEKCQVRDNTSADAVSGSARLPEHKAVETETADEAFDADRADILSYDPFYIMEYANRDYINVDSMDMSSFINVVTAAKGVATYNVGKQSDFKVTAGNFIAALTYEIPVYDVDENSKYYVAIPNVNKFNDNFKAYDLMLTYNNDYAELIGGYKYEKGILYIPKSAIDHPTNVNDVPDGQTIAIQLNYAIGGDMDFTKSIPVQILKSDEPKNKTVKVSNIFDLECLVVETGVKGRADSDVSVFLNGQLIPINDGAYRYNKETGEIRIFGCPGVISNINIVFKEQDLSESVKKGAESFASKILSKFVVEADAATTSGMKTFCDSDGNEVVLKIPKSKLFVGWRGFYRGEIDHENDAAKIKKHKGWTNSVDYMYGGKTSMIGDGDDIPDKKVDSEVIPLWAISSYAVGGDTAITTDAGIMTKYGMVKHINSDASTYTTQTIYDWFMQNRNKLEKSKIVYAERNGNGLGGSNNFALQFPSTVTGSPTNLVSSGADVDRVNEDIAFTSDQINNTYYLAAGCSHLDDTAGTDGIASDLIYVTCLEVTDDYAVFAFIKAKNGQNAGGIYKFKIRPVGKVSLHKYQTDTGVDYPSTCPVNYSLAGAVYNLYTDENGTTQAIDVNGNPVTFTTDAAGNTGKAEVDPGIYYAKEISASPGFKVNPEPMRIEINADEDKTFEAPEEPVLEPMKIILNKTDATDNFGVNRLVGAEYTIRYYDVSPSTTDIRGLTPVRTWTYATKKDDDRALINTCEDAPVSGDELFMKDGEPYIPLGVFTIEETKAPAGFTRDTGIYYGKVEQKGDDAVETIESGDSFVISTTKADDLTHEEDTQHISIKLLKKDKETGLAEAQGFGSLAGAEYKVEKMDLLASGSRYIGTMTTDANGIATEVMNASGDAVRLDPGIYYVTETKASAGYVKDPETYTIVARAPELNKPVFEYEVESKEQVHHTLFHKTDITNGVEELSGATLQIIDKNGNIVTEWVSAEEVHEVTGLADGEYTLREITAPFGYECAEDVSFEVKAGEVRTEVKMDDKPIVIHTTATDAETNSHNGLRKEQETVTDVVEYENLITGKTYTIRGYLVNQDTEKRITDASGNAVTAEKEFTAEAAAGTVKLEFTFDSSLLQNSANVVFEDLYRDGRHIATHTDINDRSQTIYYPEIRTTAGNKKTGENVGLAEESFTIIDKIYYANLSPNEKATVKGELIDKNTGEHTGVFGETTFTPEKETGSVDVEFTFNASALVNQTYVAFENLTVNGVAVTQHADINAEAQTVHIPQIGTKVGKAEKGKVNDTISYYNLIPGKTYVMRGCLVKQENGRKVRKSDGFTTFVPTEADGTVDVSLNVRNAADTVVAYEYCYVIGEDGKEYLVAQHTDLNDKNQTLTISDTSGNVVTGDPTDFIWLGIALADIVALIGVLLYIKKLRCKG